MEEIPQWAKARAVELMEKDDCSLVALARLIAQHEQPPVDPDVIAVREILAASRHDGNVFSDTHPLFQAALSVFRKHKEAGK